VEIQIGRVRLHTIAPENECLPEAIATTESIGCLFAALVPAAKTEGMIQAQPWSFSLQILNVQPTEGYSFAGNS
jgi:hypothetical protein